MAKEYDCPYFEVSAKTGNNVRRMLYSCIIDLPFFESFKIQSDNIVNELENENNETKQGLDLSVIESGRMNIKTSDEPLPTKAKQKCSC